MSDHFDERILGLTDGVLLVPVRHHSPACAAAVRALILSVRPRAVLIEGPADYNPHLAELALDHELPIAIYSYLREAEDVSRGVFYPFCEYSPEWQALAAAREVGAEARFVDAPWHAVDEDEPAANRYHDGDLRRAGYVAELCRRMGVENFDDLWDTIAESDPALAPAALLERIHRLCFSIRASETNVSLADRRREAFMAARIREALAEKPGGPLFVVTGGFHSYALFARLHGMDFVGAQEPDEFAPPPDAPVAGLTLTPYSYARLDALTGYESGMPGPGFYDYAWRRRAETSGSDTPAEPILRCLLARVTTELRKKGQSTSSADLIAAEATARGLAALRGHAEVWRRDLIDGIIGGLIKDELLLGLRHPFLDAVHEVFRGDRVGRLAVGARRPPLYDDARSRLEAEGLWPQETESRHAISLHEPDGLRRSRLLHQARVLGLTGFLQAGDSVLNQANDAIEVRELWLLHWSPALEAALIESAIYGGTLVEAAEARLVERANAQERNAESAALLLLDSCLMGRPVLGARLQGGLTRLIRQDASFFSVSGALRHLLYLYRYDDVLGASGLVGIAELLTEAWERAVWLLEGLSASGGKDKALLGGMRLLLETFERAGESLGLDRESFLAVLMRIGSDPAATPLMRGAAAGALWSLGFADTERLLAEIRYFSDPARLGDCLTGLFGLAREAAQHEPRLLAALNQLVMDYTEDEYLEALPALRLAFTFFTPREKYHIQRTVREAAGLDHANSDNVAPAASSPLQVDVGAAAAVMKFESRLMETLKRYGLRRPE